MEINTDVKRVAFYIRVSTDEQAREGYGPDYQLDALKRLIEFKSTQSPKWVTDKKHWYTDLAFSGGDLRRPGFKKMMEASKNKEFDIIAVWKIDRMSRNLSHLLKTFEDLREYGVSFFSLKENIDFSGPVGRLTFQIFGALAEFEREMIKSRTTEGKKASARRGNYTGNAIPYGYRTDKKEGVKGTKLVAVTEEKKILKQIFNWFVFDRYNYAEIAKKLTKLGVSKGVASRQKNKNTKWVGDTIKGMLENSMYLGVRIDSFKDDEGDIEKIKVKVPVLIEENIYDFAQIRISEITNDKEKKRVGGGSNEYLLSRMIIDRDTQKSFVGYKRKGGSPGYRRKLVTDKTTGIVYPNMEIPGDTIDSFIWDQVKIAIQRPEKLYKMFQKQISTSNDLERLKEDLQLCEGQIEEQEKIIENVEADFYKGNIDEIKKEKHIIKAETILKNSFKEQSQLEAKIDNLLNTMYAKELIVDMSKKYTQNIDKLTIKQKRVIIESLVDKIYAKKESGKNLRLQVVFKFDPKKIQGNSTEDELKNSTSTNKSNDAVSVSRFTGEVFKAKSEHFLRYFSYLFSVNFIKYKIYFV